MLIADCSPLLLCRSIAVQCWHMFRVSKMQMNQRSENFLILVVLAVLALMPAAALAQSSHAGRVNLHPNLLLPELKEVKLLDGGFRVGPDTRILVELGHQSEDRIAAETLAEKISDDAGITLRIVGEKPRHRQQDGAI